MARFDPSSRPELLDRTGGERPVADVGTEVATYSAWSERAPSR